MFPRGERLLRSRYHDTVVDNRAHNTSLTRRASTDKVAVDALTPIVYDELRSLARSYLQRQRSDHTLQPTALVHEAFLRLTNVEEIDCTGKAHFLCLAAKAMRSILIDHARRHNAEKRSGGWNRITLQGVLADETDHAFELLALHDALEQLAELDARQADIVELRFFGGLTGADIAEVVGISRATVVRELTMARAWLLRALDDAPPRPSEQADA